LLAYKSVSNARENVQISRGYRLAVPGKTAVDRAAGPSCQRAEKSAKIHTKLGVTGESPINKEDL
jgi:hypothetical protein